MTLTVDLGQPGEDYDVVAGKAKQLGAVDDDRRSTRARSSPSDYVLPAIKANALYGGGYPLFTALGAAADREARRRARARTGCDTIAHGCTGKGNDQVRIEATVATLDPELKIIAPVRDWTMGREEEIAYAREHGIPLKGGTEVVALLDRRQPLGPLLGGPRDRGPRRAAAGRRLPARHPARGGARRAAAAAGRLRGGAARSRSTASGSSLVELIERAGEIGAPPRRRHRRPHRGPDRRPQGPRPLRGAGGGDPAGRPPRAREARLDDPPERLQARARPPLGLPLLRRASGSSRCARTSTPTWSRPTSTSPAR